MFNTYYGPSMVLETLYRLDHKLQNNNILRYYGPAFQMRTLRLNDSKTLVQRSIAECQS